jgi:hypothetical protein
MVCKIDVTWSQIEVSILLMHKKLVHLGFTHCGGRILITNTERDKVCPNTVQYV